MRPPSASGAISPTGDYGWSVSQDVSLLSGPAPEGMQTLIAVGPDGIPAFHVDWIGDINREGLAATLTNLAGALRMRK